MKMDKEASSYVVKYYSSLLSANERLAIRHTMSTYKLGDKGYSNPNVLKIYREKGWLTSDQKVLELLKDGYDKFEFKIAQRILDEYPNRVFLNKCPQCKKLARTPYARQCRYCMYNWHDSVVAEIKISDCLQLIGRPHLFILGELVAGTVKFGDHIDLVPLGLAMQPEIKAIEFVRKSRGGRVWDDISLGFDNPGEEDKSVLQEVRNTGRTIEILREL